MHPKVDEFLSQPENQWSAEMQTLRQIMIACGLTEEWKWRQPCYTWNGANVTILGGYKQFCGLSFFKGVLLKDPHKLLQKPGENSRSAMWIPLTSTKDIIEKADTIKSYVFEAIEVEKAGLKVPFKDNTPLERTEELSTRLEQHPALKKAFEALTPGRQRAYLLFFSAAKQAETRFARIDKYTERILMGKGMNDCICGLSKRMPNCDGSHKQLT
jgi:uncharacterized protein YdeI (YjbR/CyaY-like superfamily)